MERRVVMRLTSPRASRNGSGSFRDEQARAERKRERERERERERGGGGREPLSLRVSGCGIRAGSRGILTTINNRIRSAIGDFVSHSGRPGTIREGEGWHCAPSRSSFAPHSRPRFFDPAVSPRVLRARGK